MIPARRLRRRNARRYDHRVTQIPPAVEQSAPGKVILCGEHAVVYGRPAIALPLPTLRAVAHIRADEDPLWIEAPDINQRVDVTRDPQHPLAQIAQLTLAYLGKPVPCARLVVRSRIPIGANLGSGAAVSVAIARAIAAWHGVTLPPEAASALAFEVEKVYHGSPSGVDNTVVAWERPVWFVKGEAVTFLEVRARLPLVIASVGFTTPTRVTVADVRAGWQRDPQRYEAIFTQIGEVVHATREALVRGDLVRLGAAMNANHALLQELNVSCAELDRLCAAARAAGALGAKMSGGGRGGNMVALAADAGQAARVGEALLAAGAAQLTLT